MRVKFKQDDDHWHSPSRCTAYKADKSYTVPRAYGESVVESGKAEEVKSSQPKKAQGKPQKSTQSDKNASGDRS